ncbi:hypothetical protein AURDEDRAFT_187236 [Auricularia subglabra TFB-10046 SS5]|uniref:F-box domain-containing protein n=1 Tax=Auricularia subglabra (strain TFB-10046 / SS5) TaxID=717982 RepID=J0D1J0_AURST|nr:hypothetical protein AURDEDRAFT_187236 [Auricularia subglabra TFB-10046 SS5]
MMAVMGLGHWATGTRLPPEILSLIFSALEAVSDVNRCRLVCKAWSCLAWHPKHSSFAFRYGSTPIPSLLRRRLASSPRPLSIEVMLDADVNFVRCDILPALSDGMNRVEELFLHSGDAPIALAALEALQKPAPCLARLDLGFSFSSITPEHLSLMGNLFAGQAPRLERLSFYHTDWLKPVIPAFRTVGAVNLEFFPTSQWSPEHMSRCFPRLHKLRIMTEEAGMWDDDFVFPPTLKTVELEAPWAPHLLRHFSPETPLLEAANMDSAGVAEVLFSHLPSGALEVHVHPKPWMESPAHRVTHRASGLARGMHFYTDDLAYALPRTADLLGPLGLLDRILALDICVLYLTCGDAETPPQLMLPGLQHLTVSGIQNPAWITIPRRPALRINTPGLQVLQLSALAEHTSIPVADVTHFMGAVLQLGARRAVELVLHGVSLEGDQKGVWGYLSQIRNTYFAPAYNS